MQQFITKWQAKPHHWLGDESVSGSFYATWLLIKADLSNAHWVLEFFWRKAVTFAVGRGVKQQLPWHTTQTICKCVVVLYVSLVYSI